MPRNRKEKTRDVREFDTTQLHEKAHGTGLGRDYSAHFFRWNFARRFINAKSNVLEIGCGEEKPLAKILTMGAMAQVNEYTGVDLNKLSSKGGVGKRATFIGEFNFVKRWKELKRADAGFDVVIHLEVIEHMRVDHGRTMLKACYDLLKPGGIMLMSTPCYDGKRHAANHIHEYTVPELDQAARKVGFVVERRWGTFMDVRHVPKTPGLDPELAKAVKSVHSVLEQYYDRDAISCFFAPLFPDHARNNLWVCRKPGGGR